jgi:hypothetical protein
MPFMEAESAANVLYEEIAAHRQPPEEMREARAKLRAVSKRVDRLIGQLKRRGGQSKEQQEQLQIFADKRTETLRLRDTDDGAASEELTRKPEAG